MAVKLAMLWLAAIWSQLLAVALADTSPVLVISSKSDMPRPQPEQIQEDTITWINDEIVLRAVQSCSFDAYIFVDQPQVSQRQINDKWTPFLYQIFNKAQDKMAFPDVEMDIASTSDYAAEAHVTNTCEASVVNVNLQNGQFSHYTDIAPRLFSLQFGPVSSNEELLANDRVLREVVGHLPSGNFIVVYRTTPALRDSSLSTESESEPATAVSPSSSVPTHNPATHKVDDKYVSLFVNYQFLSPGLYMTISVTLILAGILIVTIQWLSALQVSYKSFTKDAVPKAKQG